MIRSDLLSALLQLEVAVELHGLDAIHKNPPVDYFMSILNHAHATPQSVGKPGTPEYWVSPDPGGVKFIVNKKGRVTAGRADSYDHSDFLPKNPVDDDFKWYGYAQRHKDKPGGVFQLNDTNGKSVPHSQYKDHPFLNRLRDHLTHTDYNMNPIKSDVY